MTTLHIASDANNAKATDNLESVGSGKTPAPSDLCSYCAKPAITACRGCVNAPAFDDNHPPKTFYCNSVCQKADWTKHNVTCKVLCVRKQVYRAGDVIQRVFYTYRERLFEIPITKVEKEHHRMYLYEGQYADNQFLVLFPHHLFSSEDDKNRALAYNACTDSTAFMHYLVKAFLEGICTSISEPTMNLPETPFRVYHVDEHRNYDTREYQHEVFCVTVNGGEMYAIDLSGIQYGWVETVVPWPQYLRSRLDGDPKRVAAIHPFGYSLYNARMLSRGFDDPLQPLASTMKQNLRYADYLAAGCWGFAEGEGEGPLGDSLKLPQAAFEEKRDKFVFFITEVLKRGKAGW
ncbi:MAG: hypothetical protein Q9218_003721 [Villophora microphyllina]